MPLATAPPGSNFLVDLSQNLAEIAQFDHVMAKSQLEI
jgi:hypothetical protein